MDSDVKWIYEDFSGSKARRKRCSQGLILSSYQAFVDHPLRAKVLGHDIDVNRYMETARKWLPENGWTITKDYITESGSKRLVAVNRDVEVDFDLGGYEKAFGLFVAGPCRTVVNWPN